MSNHSTPKVSVVIPIRNGVELLPCTVESVLAQTYADLELIIVVDDSDTAFKGVAGYSDDRIRAIRKVGGMELPSALNTGIAVARGEYIAFVDNEDVWLPGKLALQVHALDAASPQVAMVYGWYDLMDSGSSPQAVRETSRGDLFERVLVLDTFAQPSTWLLRRTVLSALGCFAETVHHTMIYIDLVCRLCLRGWRVDYVPHIVLHRRLLRRGQLTTDTRDDLAAKAAFVHGHLARFADELRSRPAARAKVLIRLSECQFRYCRRRGLTSFARAFFADPTGLVAKIPTYGRRLYRLLLRSRPPQIATR